MSEPTEHTAPPLATQNAGKSATAPTPGEWLRAERELQGRTVQQVAADLHLSVNVVEAIEENRFGVLGAPVFARGHLRNYANLLGLPIERAHQLYDALTDRPRDQDPVPVIHRAGEPSIPMTPDSKERDVRAPQSRMMIAIAVVALVVAALAAWWWLNTGNQAEHAAPVSVPLTQSPEQPPSDDSEAEPIEAAAPDANVAASNTPRVESTPAQANVPPAIVPTPRASTNATMRLSLTFAEQSWVEVYDARGTRRLYDVGEAGQTRTVQVEPPAQLVFGNAPAVSLAANGRPVTVPQRVANQVARFTLRADGSIQ